MNENENMSENTTEQMTPPQPKKSNGSMVGVIIIILILVIGAIYFLSQGNSKTEEDIIKQVEEVSIQPIEEEVANIESELNIDAELQAIEDGTGDLSLIDFDFSDEELGI